MSSPIGPWTELVVTPEGVARLEIRRPEALNALNSAVLAELRARLEDIARLTPTPRVLVLASAGDRAFVAGSDLAELVNLGPNEAEEFSRAGQDICHRLELLPCVVVARVQGFALGSGTELALACDLVIASETAVFGLPETGLGVIPGHGGTARLAARVGLGRARELMITGRKLPAAEALRLGLVDRVAPADRLDAELDALTAHLTQRSPSALAALKALMRSPSATLEARLAEETRVFSNLFGAPDQREGMTAFLEKRAPRFRTD